MRPGVKDRDADVWEALLATADAAGGSWPTRAREAAVALVSEGKESNPSLGIRLLADLRTLFALADRMSTDELLTGLSNLDDAPWGELRGKPLSNLGLSRLLNPFGVKPKPLRFGDKVVRGYARGDFYDAWNRYLPQMTGKAVTPVTDATRATDGPQSSSHV
jgi:hypothetical protein